MLTLRRRSLSRIIFFLALAFAVKVLFFSPAPADNEIQKHNVLDYVSRDDRLDVRRHKFLQSRMGRDERPDILSDIIDNGVNDYWERFQKPFISGKDTAVMDAQSVMTSIEQLLSLNGWVAALCPTLTRPFGQNTLDSAYDELAQQDHLYYIAIVIHSADHFLVDQLAVIVQLAKRLGPQNLFVSMLDYDSSDSTETLTDLAEAVLILLGIPYRIRRVPGMTVDPGAAYYPLEEAHMRNLALEPLHELYTRRKIKFHRVIWLKGFTCPNDIFETIKVSQTNDAAMVCGMDWAEHNGFYIFSDRWRTRDINGDQFRQSKSSSNADAVPVRDRTGAQRYAQHLPFQVFCCEAGTHVVDPAQSYYAGVAYRAGMDYHNATAASTTESPPARSPGAPCLDSSQAWFCRDLWLLKAKEGMSDMDGSDDDVRRRRKRDIVPPEPAAVIERRDAPKEEREHPAPAQEKREPAAEGDKRDIVDAAVGRKDAHRQAAVVDPDANAGSDYDAMDDADGAEDVPAPPPVKLSIPNSAFRPARIVVNPRCVTTYAGVSHTQLARDLFGADDKVSAGGEGKYVLEDWEGAPESFVCQEQRQTGGRKATKTQRRLGFSLHDELRDS